MSVFLFLIFFVGLCLVFGGSSSPAPAAAPAPVVPAAVAAAASAPAPAPSVCSVPLPSSLGFAPLPLPAGVVPTACCLLRSRSGSPLRGSAASARVRRLRSLGVLV